MALFSDVLLTVDYDRTLTAPDSSIPPRNMEAIHYFMDNGGAFTINTGRSLSMAKPIMDSVPMNAPILLYNGSAAYDLEKQELLFCHEIDLDPWETVAKCRELFPDLMTEIQGLNANYRLWDNPAWDAFYAHIGVAHEFVQPGDDIGPFLKFSVFGPITSVDADNFFVANAQEKARLDQVYDITKEVFGHKCQVYRSGDKIVDLLTPGVSKGLSARRLKKELGRKLLVCAGDADNDRPMLQDADYAFVPADAALAGEFPTVCKCAEGAVAEVIYEKIPEILKNIS